MSITYKERTPTKEDFWKLFATTGWNREYRLSPAKLIGAVRQNWYSVSVYQDKCLIGFGRVVSDGILHAMIYDLIVDPHCQRQGIGEELLSKLVHACLDARIRDIQLFCARGKRSFYEKRGFRSRPDDSPGMQYAGALKQSERSR